MNYMNLEKMNIFLAKGITLPMKIFVIFLILVAIIIAIYFGIKFIKDTKVKKTYSKVVNRLNKLEENSTEKKFKKIIKNTSSFRVRKGIYASIDEYKNLRSTLIEKIAIIFGVATKHYEAKDFSEAQKHLNLLRNNVVLAEEELYKINNKAMSFYKTFDYEIYNIEEAKELYMLIVGDFEKYPIRYSDISQKLIKRINAIGNDFDNYYKELNGENNEIMLLSIFEDIVFALKKVEKTMLRTPEMIVEARKLSTSLQNLYERYNRLISVGYKGNEEFESSYNTNVEKLKLVSEELINISNVDKSRKEINEISEFTETEMKIVEQEYESYQNLNSKIFDFKVEQKKYLTKISNIKEQYYKSVETQNSDFDFNILEDYENKIRITHNIMETDFNLANKDVESYNELESQYNFYEREFEKIKVDVDRIEIKLEKAYDQVGYNTKKIYKSIHNINGLEEKVIAAFSEGSTHKILIDLIYEKDKLLALEEKLKSNYSEVDSVADEIENKLNIIGEKCVKIKNYIYSFSFSEYLLVHVNRYRGIDNILDVEIALIEDAYSREKFDKVIERSKIFFDKINENKYNNLLDKFKVQGNGFYAH